MKFPRRARLITPGEYRNVFARPEVSRDRFFRVLSRTNGLAFCRLGLAVSRKVCRGAADRNRIKRVIRESFRLHQRELAGQGGRDIVVLPNPLAATICNSELSESLARHWRTLQEARQPQGPGERQRN